VGLECSQSWFVGILSPKKGEREDEKPVGTSKLLNHRREKKRKKEKEERCNLPIARSEALGCKEKGGKENGDFGLSREGEGEKGKGKKVRASKFQRRGSL